MFYYLVWVRSQRYHGKKPLTYASDKRLEAGSLVEVELQNTLVVGFVSSLTTKPRFKVKEIARIFNLPPLPAHNLKLINWLMDYYPAPLGIVSQQLLPAAISDIDPELEKSKLSPLNKSVLPSLNDEQTKAFSEITSQTDTYLLHGRTGSGKTRLYIELAIASIEQNNSVIVLTPEISLTSQLASNFKAVFGERVIVMHSKQTPKERRLSWIECLTSLEPKIVIGPRSALFAPLRSIGLIILDESHESAYKQTSSPQYQTGRVASYLAKISHASLILGSATPLISDYYLAQQKSKPIIKLTKLAQASDFEPVKVEIVDRKEHSLFSQSPFLSQPLIKAASAALTSKKQVLFYLNRRGTAKLVMCENCGWQATCPHCDIPLTYHGDSHEIRCHSCSYKASSPVSCPDCHSPNIAFKTAGTKAIAADVARLFPEAKIARFDTDNTKAESFEQNYELARDGKIDILVGTQMLAKGLDLPRLGLVGVLLADTSLYIPDFTADERTFQLLNQVLGRVGRGHTKGQAIIQTYHPDHPIINYAINNDYDTFYEVELDSRREFLFPPFCYLLKLSVRRASVKSAESAAEDLKDSIMKKGYRVLVEGPAPSFHEHIQGKYEWQLIVKSKSREQLLTIIEELPANWLYDIDPVDLL